VVFVGGREVQLQWSNLRKNPFFKHNFPKILWGGPDMEGHSD
jgi:hypothetical protein